MNLQPDLTGKDVYPDGWTGYHDPATGVYVVVSKPFGANRGWHISISLPDRVPDAQLIQDCLYALMERKVIPPSLVLAASYNEPLNLVHFDQQIPLVSWLLDIVSHIGVIRWLLNLRRLG